jgi:hypothetical protein
VVEESATLTTYGAVEVKVVLVKPIPVVVEVVELIYLLRVLAARVGQVS